LNSYVAVVPVAKWQPCRVYMA